jgi:hypothetical protein
MHDGQAFRALTRLNRQRHKNSKSQSSDVLNLKFKNEANQSDPNVKLSDSLLYMYNFYFYQVTASFYLINCRIERGRSEGKSK